MLQETHNKKDIKMSKTTIQQLYGIDAKSLIGIPHEDALKIKLYAASKHALNLAMQIRDINIEECGSCEILIILCKEMMKLDNVINENMAELDEMGISYKHTT